MKFLIFEFTHSNSETEYYGKLARAGKMKIIILTLLG